MTEAEMMADLAAADAAGDTDLAQHIAGRIKAARAPPPAPPGMGEALARGAGQGATLGFGDEINAAIQAAGIKAAGQTGAQKPFAQLYQENRDTFRRENEAAQAAHPYAYGGGQLVGGAPLALATGGGGTARLIGTSAALGGAAGLGEAQGGAGTQLKSALLGAGLGGALAGAPVLAGKALPAVRNALEEGATNTARRIFRNVGGSLSNKTPLSADAIKEALSSGAVVGGGTSKGAAARLEQLRETVGDQYGQIVGSLEKAGIQGPDAKALAAQIRTAGKAAAEDTVNKGVLPIYEGVADQIEGKTTQGGRFALSRMEKLKRSAQEAAESAYKQQEPGEIGRAHKDVARMLKEATENEIAQQAPNAAPDVQQLASQFEPVKDRLGKIIAAHDVAREGQNRALNRNAVSLRDMLMATSGMGAGAASHGVVGGLIGGPVAGLASHALMERGPSTAVAAMRGGAGALDYLMGPALTPMQARTQAMIQALRTRALPLAAEEAGGSSAR